MTVTADTIAMCIHCGLPSGLRPSVRRIGGTTCTFCCYGCALAFQVRSGIFEEAEAAWDLVRLGVGAFFAMNIMLLSLLLYSGALDVGTDGLRQVVHGALWLLATPAVAILGWPFARDAWQGLRAGRLGSGSLVVVGVGAAYGYSALAVVAGGTEVYFDTATMVLALFTLGRCIEAVGRARAARDLAPMLEAESQWVTRVQAGTEVRCAVTAIAPGDWIRVSAGERIAIDGRVLDGRARVDEAVISGEGRPIAKQPGDHVIAGSVALDDQGAQHGGHTLAAPPISL
jgi:Cu2+-exporting ATPase